MTFSLQWLVTRLVVGSPDALLFLDECREEKINEMDLQHPKSLLRCVRHPVTVVHVYNDCSAAIGVIIIHVSFPLWCQLPCQQ